MPKQNPHRGSSFEDFLREDGLYEEVRARIPLPGSYLLSGLDMVNNVHYQELYMGTLHRFGKFRLLVLGREHGVIHFHVAGPDCSFAMDAQTLEVLAGEPPPDVLRKVRAWAMANRQAILAAWKEMNG